MNEKKILLADHRGLGLHADLLSLEQAGYTLHATRCVRETAEALEHGSFEALIVAPLVEGGRVELEAVDRSRAGDGTPVMVVTCLEGVGPAIAAAATLQRGPWDLMHIGAPPEEVLMRVTRLSAHAASHGEMEELRWRAHHDERTGLLRPDVFAARLAEHFSAAQRHGMDLALVLVDLDRFGAINKDFDHTIGDAVIASVGKVMRAGRRAEDVASRLGGDEFALLLPYTRPVEAATVVRRLCHEIHELSHAAPPEFGGADGAARRIEVSASIGFETFNGSDVSSHAQLRRHAEIALREAKQRRGNQAVYYRSLSGEAVRDRATLCPSVAG